MNTSIQLDSADNNSRQEQLCSAIEISWQVAHKAKEEHDHAQHVHCWNGVYYRLTGITDWIIYSENLNDPEIKELISDIQLLYTIAGIHQIS